MDIPAKVLRVDLFVELAGGIIVSLIGGAIAFGSGMFDTARMIVAVVEVIAAEMCLPILCSVDTRSGDSIDGFPAKAIDVVRPEISCADVNTRAATIFTFEFVPILSSSSEMSRFGCEACSC